MQWSLAEGPGWASAYFYPAALNAYRRMRELLAAGASPELPKQVHAEVCGIFEQQHYGGVQLEFCCILVDEWLNEVVPGHGMPSVLRLFQAKRAEAFANSGWLPGR